MKDSSMLKFISNEDSLSTIEGQCWFKCTVLSDLAIRMIHVTYRSSVSTNKFYKFPTLLVVPPSII